MALEAWLDSTKQRQVDVVRALDVSKQLVSFWVTGHGIPGLELAEALQALTDGAVQVMDWRVPAAADTDAETRGGQRALQQHLRVARQRGRAQRR